MRTNPSLHISITAFTLKGAAENRLPVHMDIRSWNYQTRSGLMIPSTCDACISFYYGFSPSRSHKQNKQGKQKWVLCPEVLCRSIYHRFANRPVHPNRQIPPCHSRLHTNGKYYFSQTRNLHGLYRIGDSNTAYPDSFDKVRIQHGTCHRHAYIFRCADRILFQIVCLGNK